MITFKNFISEESDLKFKTDNPGGRWLEGKKKNAEEHIKEGGTGITGSVTGYYTKTIKLPVNKISHFKGAMGEEKHRETSQKMKDLEKSVGHHSNFNTEKHPIMIGINHRGEPKVVEGNHRLAYAKKHGISHIHAEVKYYNGGEEVDGEMHPNKVEKMAK